MLEAEWKKGETRIAIANEKGEWEYFTFLTWEEAREAVNVAREQGKRAVFYDGATLPEAPMK